MRRSHAMAFLLAGGLAACAAEGPMEPHQVQPEATDANFMLYITNRSALLDPVDMKVFLGGKLSVEGDFPSGKEYVFQFKLNAGGNNLSASTEAGDTQYLNLFQIRSGVTYGVLEFWDESPQSSGPPGPLFSFELLDQPPAFD